MVRGSALTERIRDQLAVSRRTLALYLLVYLSAGNYAVRTIEACLFPANR